MNAASDRQYDALGRAIVALARLRGGPAPEDLCMHKALLPPRWEGGKSVSAGKSAVERWLAAQLRADAPARVLDVGCGFGSFLATLRQGWDGEAVGINASGFPIDYGRRYWRARDPLRAPDLRTGLFGAAVPGTPFDAIAAIESLGYAEHLDETLAWLRDLLRPRGRLWILDDWCAAGLPQDDPDVDALCRRWRRPGLYPCEALLSAGATQGLVLVRRQSLTALVPATRRPPGAPRRRLLHALTGLGGRTAAGQVAAAFLGGWHLDALYARGCARYELLVLERPPVG